MVVKLVVDAVQYAGSKALALGNVMQQGLNPAAFNGFVDALYPELGLTEPKVGGACSSIQHGDGRVGVADLSYLSAPATGACAANEILSRR